MNFKDDILSKPSLVAHWRLGSLDVWKHNGIVEAINAGPVRRNLITGGSFEDGITGWAGLGGFIAGTSTLSRDPSPYVGSQALKVVTPATTNAGAQTSGMASLVLQAGVTYSVSLFVKQQAGGAAISRIAMADSTGAETTVAGNVTIGTGYTRYQAFVTPANSGPATLYVRQNSATASTYWIDAVACIPSTVDVGYGDGDEFLQPRIFGQAQGAQVVGGGAAGGMPNDILAGSTAFTATVADAIQVPHQAPLAITGDMTILAVVNVTSFPSNRGILSKLGASAAAPYDMRINAASGAMGYTFGNGTTEAGFNDGLAMPTGTPVMVACTVSGTTVTMYRNGIQAGGTGSLATQPRSDAGNPVHIGRKANFTDPFLGTIQDLTIFNAALSANELLALAKEAGFA